MDFLKGDPSVVASPFPLCADEDNAYRYDPYDAMKYHNIYRDIWERKLPKKKDWHHIRRNTFDYPELKGMFRAVSGSKAIPTSRPEHEEGGVGIQANAKRQLSPEEERDSQRRKGENIQDLSVKDVEF